MKKIKLTSNHKNRVLIVIASITVILFLSFAIIVGIQRKNSSTVTPLTEKEVNLSNGSQYAFNGFVLGMPYKEMEKKLKKTEDFTPDIRDLEIKGDLYHT